MSFESFVERLRVALDIDIPDPVNPYDGLYDDIGLDSFQAYELLIIIETLAGSLVPPVHVPELYTLADAFEYYERLKAEAADAAEL